MSDVGYTRLEPGSGDPRFPSLLQGFNRRWFAPNCRAVYLCRNANGVAAALDEALAHGGEVKVKGGGHCYEGFVFNDDTRHVLDLSPMAAVGVDERGYYLEAGGTNWGAYQALFRGFGKTLPAGSCYSVGLGGHICGGGYGLLSRLHGLTVDWLTGVEIVVKDDARVPARVIYVGQDSRGDEQDLYWASSGGGGGNFGIITRYYFARLPDSPSTAILATEAVDWQGLTVDRLQHLVDLIADFSSRDDELARRTFLIGKLTHQAAQQMHLVAQVALDAELGLEKARRELLEPLFDELRERVELVPVRVPIIGHLGWFTSMPPETGAWQDLTYYEALQTVNGSGPNLRGKYKSAYMRKRFPDDQVAAVFEHLQRVPDGLTAADMSQSLLQVDSYGGAINDRSPTATPIAQRSSIMKLQYQCYWADETPIGRGDPTRDEAFLQWIRDLYRAVYARSGGIPDPAQDPSGIVDGCYYNYPDVDLNDYGLDTALRLYFLDNFRANPRNLVAVKRRWDPNDYFHHAQSIPTD